MKVLKVLERIRNNESKEIEGIYDKYIKRFVNHFHFKYGVEYDLANEIYNDAVLTFVIKVQTERIKSLDCSIKTFLYAIGYKFMLKKYEQIQKFANEDIESKAMEVIRFADNLESSERKEYLIKAIGKLSPECREIIDLSFFKDWENEIIAKRLGFDTVNALRIKKSRCIQKIRNIIFKNEEFWR
jgi:RNA polymerase sigma factor (sigma-70 family)